MRVHCIILWSEQIANRHSLVEEYEFCRLFQAVNRVLALMIYEQRKKKKKKKEEEEEEEEKKKKKEEEEEEEGGIKTEEEP